MSEVLNMIYNQIKNQFGELLFNYYQRVVAYWLRNPKTSLRSLTKSLELNGE